MEQKLQQELDKLKEEGSAEWQDRAQDPEYIEHKRKAYTNQAEKHRYVIYDFEADVHTLTHMPNHVEADVLQVDKNNNTYEDCLTNTFRHNGYDAVEKFCDWLFTAEHYNSTVIAHNQAGYDGRFILQYALKRGLRPTQYIRQGPRIMYMALKNIDYGLFQIEFDLCKVSGFHGFSRGEFSYSVNHFMIIGL